MVYFAAYIPYYAWIVNLLFTLPKKKIPWVWEDQQRHTFELAKRALTSAPIRAFPIQGLGYQLYTDACDIGIAAILQQIQPITISDLQGIKIYKKLEIAYQKQENIPNLVVPIDKDKFMPSSSSWANEFEKTLVIHCAGWVHSNVDPISRLRRCFPVEQGPASDDTKTLDFYVAEKDPLTNLFDELGLDFEAGVLQSCSSVLRNKAQGCLDKKKINISFEHEVLGSSYSVIIGINEKELKEFINRYLKDAHFSKVHDALKTEENWENPTYPQYYLGDEGLIFFEDVLRRNQLCIPQNLKI
ncbi:hypothetical protein Clacol_009769 [Clathrus columnatus]|uniref:Reverse transcriptase/retrotransposon-derived protein RNase H-like domain-containing protein n=1 Tax=Clathrus columnatus TaxID=1419009 RepID=A0AAV5ARP0_9AGAM|nr:hypothetical protein Clacol_009769 [Clathrus columnatus]